MPSSPVYRPSRAIRQNTKLLLWVQAGGRCEFDGCNEYLLRHHVTLERVNLAELAHIVAFKPDGPRGADKERPEDINDVANLMLLCPRCHKLIDDNATTAKYTRAMLEKRKREHEERILHLTDAKPERKTTVVQVLAKAGGQIPAIPPSQVWDAVAPMYPGDEKGCVIDLTLLDDGTDAFYELAAAEIDRAIAMLYRPGLQVAAPRHLSLFALAPMPLLVHLGRRLSNKIPVDLYQRHRDTQDWTWKDSGPEVRYRTRVMRTGTMADRVALLLSLSDVVDESGLPVEVDAAYSVYEITLEEETPSAWFLRRRQDLDGFRRTYQETIAAIVRDHRTVSRIDVFPIVPAPIAVLCGFELFPKVSPALRVFDRDRRRGGWSQMLTVS